MYNITQLAKEKKNPYKSRDHFLSDREYGRYVKTVLQPGMKVRARETYESVSMGDFGVYLQTNDGTPPAQVTWEGLGDAYWVYWHQVDLLPSEDEKKTTNSSEWGRVCVCVCVGGGRSIYLGMANKCLMPQGMFCFA